MYGRQGVAPGTPPALTDLGLYSITFMNDAELDRAAGERYREFRIEAERWGFKHFLEVFNPNVGSDRLSRAEIGEFVNDSIVRVIAAVPEACRPQFLKIAYNGPQALEELVAYDPSIIVGILGGGAGTTRDTFELLAAAQRGGARLVLFGRKINLAEDPLALVALMKRRGRRRDRAGGCGARLPRRAGQEPACRRCARSRTIWRSRRTCCADPVDLSRRRRAIRPLERRARAGRPRAAGVACGYAGA